MARNYVKKKADGNNIEMLKAAIAAVEGGLSIYKASKQFNVPESTMGNRIKTGSSDVGAGRPTLLSPEIEKELANNVILLSEIHRPLTRQEVLAIIEDYFVGTKKNNPFSKANKVPCREWMECFLKRHPEIVRRKAVALQIARAQSSTKAAFEVFFKKLGEKIAELNITSAEQIINLDETGYNK